MNESQDVLKMSPEKLMAGFTRSRFGLWIGLAVVVHVFCIGTLSLGYIRDTWIDPEGAAERKAAVEALVKANAPKPPAPPTPAPAPASTNVAAAPVSDKTLMQQRSNAPIIKAITDLPDKTEIPKQPNDLGISLDDTRVK
ncbi:MAG: hypothetical protein PCFJNLEI_02256 [Verrucomicrobiae bacterium]|nr:hypothetical protein [Verrucomicrobiae bacterium]